MATLFISSRNEETFTLGALEKNEYRVRYTIIQEIYAVMGIDLLTKR